VSLKESLCRGRRRAASRGLNRWIGERRGVRVGHGETVAYLLNYDCVQPAAAGLQPFPTQDLTALQHVVLGSATCAPK